MSAKAPIYLKRGGRKGKKEKLRDLLSRDMISPPLGDFRHTIHVGGAGDTFGDVSFLQGKLHLLPRAREAPEPPAGVARTATLSGPPRGYGGAVAAAQERRVAARHRGAARAHAAARAAKTAAAAAGREDATTGRWGGQQWTCRGVPGAVPGAVVCRALTHGRRGQRCHRAAHRLPPVAARGPGPVHPGGRPARDGQTPRDPHVRAPTGGDVTNNHYWQFWRFSSAVHLEFQLRRLGYNRGDGDAERFSPLCRDQLVVATDPTARNRTRQKRRRANRQTPNLGCFGGFSHGGGWSGRIQPRYHHRDLTHHRVL
ncbi:hypothetical protein Q9966_016234 [Columba livia]|nr:hypothetical protein Q9966_016234 [Columba livia]